MTPVNWDVDSGEVQISGLPLRLIRAVQRGWARVSPALRGFAGYGGESYLLPRWVFLRLFGVAFLMMFIGWCIEGVAIIGPNGIMPVATHLAAVSKKGSELSQFLAAPTLLWLSSSAAMIRLVSWSGVVVSLALVLNVLPRASLFLCWVLHLSLVTVSTHISGTQIENVLLETAFLAMFFAPSGLRPGLGAASPPRPLSVFMMRFLVLRVILESGLIKFTAGDPLWRSFEAMDVMYEGTPFPTIIGYYMHHMPHWWHAGEVAFTILVEIVGPVLALFGAWGRFAAFALWTAFHLAIHVSANFGPLNLIAISLGFLLLDDATIWKVAERLNAPRAARWLRDAVARQAAIVRLGGARRAALYAIFGVHFYISLVLGLDTITPFSSEMLPDWMVRPIDLIWNFRSVNRYTLYWRIREARYLIEFRGSDDGGKTWRPYRHKYLPQDESHICPFIAPYFPRFEAALQIIALTEGKSSVVASVARRLLEGSPEVLSLFKDDPFNGHRPEAIRFTTYHYVFNPISEQRKTGKYWTRTAEDEYLPPLIRDEGTGKVHFEGMN